VGHFPSGGIILLVTFITMMRRITPSRTIAKSAMMRLMRLMRGAALGVEADVGFGSELGTEAHRYCGLCSSAKRMHFVENWAKMNLIFEVGFALPLADLKRMVWRD
jgi:hypothetical protein